MSEAVPKRVFSLTFEEQVRAFFAVLRAKAAAIALEGRAPTSAENETRTALMLSFGEQLDQRMFSSPKPDASTHWPVLVTKDGAQWPKTVWGEGAAPIWVLFAHLPSLLWSTAGLFTHEAIPLDILTQISELVSKLTEHGPLDVDQLTVFLLEVVRFQMAIIWPADSK
jgi:hypothetical protein